MVATPPAYESDVGKDRTISVGFHVGISITTNFKFAYKSNPVVNKLYPLQQIIRYNNFGNEIRALEDPVSWMLCW